MKQNAQLMAMLYVDSIEQARSFYVDKLGFSHMMGMLGKDGLLDFCTVSLAGARVMLMRPAQAMRGTAANGEKQPVELYVEVENVEDYHAAVKEKGIKPTAPLTDQWWGDRTFTVMDPFGYLIWFYQNVGEVKLPQGAKIV
jgi:PhnB protein